MILNSKWQKTTNKNELLILILKSQKEFAALEIHWNKLHARALQFGTSFQQAYNRWQLIKKGHHDLFIITIWDGTMLIGVAPLYRKKIDSTASVVSLRGMQNSPRNKPGGFCAKTEKYSICDFSDIMVDNSYLNIFAERLIDPSCLNSKLLELEYSDRYANEYLYPRLQK